MKYSLVYWFSLFAAGEIMRWIVNYFQIPPFCVGGIRGFIYRAIVNYAVVYKFLRRYIYRRCPESYRLEHNETVIVTGASAGIGIEVAKELIQRGGKVIWACRNTEAAFNVLQDIRWKPSYGPRGYVLKLDLASKKSIENFVHEFRSRENKLNVLVLNAGVMARSHQVTEDGFEQTFGVNHLGHMYLTYLLQDMLKESHSDECPSRVIVVSSDLHRFMKRVHFENLMFDKPGSGFPGMTAYYQSKLCNILFARKLSRLWKEQGVIVHSAHPGTPVLTQLLREGQLRYFIIREVLFPVLAILHLRSPNDAAHALIYAMLAPECLSVSGRYYENCMTATPTKAAQSDANADELWTVSCQLLEISEDW